VPQENIDPKRLFLRRLCKELHPLASSVDVGERAEKQGQVVKGNADDVMDIAMNLMLYV